MTDHVSSSDPDGHKKVPDSEQFSACLTNIAMRQDRESFTILFRHYAPRLKSYMLKLGNDDAQAEEIAQDVMVTVWRKAGQFDPKRSSPSTWIFRIARNRGIDLHRRKARPALDENDPILRPEEIQPPDQMLERAEEDALIRDELAQLPSEQRDLLKASFYLGLPHAEIARLYQIPLGTVKSRIRLGFDRLRGKLVKP